MLVLLVPGVGMGASPVGDAEVAAGGAGNLAWYIVHRAVVLLMAAGAAGGIA